MLAGDVIVSLDGTATTTIQRYEQELVHMYATSVSDAVRVQVIDVTAGARGRGRVELGGAHAGRRRATSRGARRAPAFALGGYTFACMQQLTRTVVMYDARALAKQITCRSTLKQAGAARTRRMSVGGA